MNEAPAPRSVVWISVFGVLLLTWCVYLPGLSGGFLFDDFINLNALGSSGPIDNWAIFWRYVTSGTADPTGRPLALLSFLIDARDWPADPGPFLRTNLVIHLLNGALLFALLQMLGRALADASEAGIAAAALLATALWLMHPLLVSTTLYAVQREAMLPATFVLLGLIAYSRGRTTFAETSGRSGSALMWSGIGVGTLLALLCKANGMLLPLLAWAIDVTVFRALPLLKSRSAPARRLARIRWCLLILPSVVILAYLVHFLGDWSLTPANRAWTIGQRALTEPRILLDYLQLLFIPRSVSSGLFNDHYQASRGLMFPITTLLSMLSVGAALVSAFHFRRRIPALAAAVLFFFGGHLVESSAVPLELYFEHRNYLPALLLFWPLARAICAWEVGPWLRAGVALLLVAIVAATTVQRTRLWGDPGQLATLWARLTPESSRAQASVAMYLVQNGQPQRAQSVLAPLWQARPDDLQLASSYFVAACADRSGLSRADKFAISRTIRAATTDQDLLYRWLAQATETAAARDCGNLSLDDVQAWIMETGRQSRTRERAQRMRDSLVGRLDLFRGNPDAALMHFDRHLEKNPTPETAAIQSALLGSRGYFTHALAHLDTYERMRGKMLRPGPGMPFLHARVLAWQRYWPGEMQWLRSNFEQAQRSQSKTR